ncbi:MULTISPECIES: serine hydrolase domain-containing protein [unclassified Lysobacter]|uniref:serine hydrolase domain-containing protein n=1 Tax=unclassified Lysobacter TaxID=2635362 RepID=UPI001BE67AF8|nr:MULTISPECIES: serine hydrolase domain-containing protein [unclassified Lysobacter]MBT2748708.1 beta-lactamase family protein [Lysobacter sp. ISL-42]MBT2751643.1 beta-lactamase family protein [Lysobacter sp. ISL-50]MBT2775837.1 beta-lactamase family protein [Lysobacter sp. ISL-54]MBT2782198.1 beta-lactamase family protein [Lysobacter sp. ISL-52]
MSHALPKRTPSSATAAALRRCLLAALLACTAGGATWAQTAGSAATAESAMGTPGKTPSGHGYIVPPDWTQARRGHAVVLQAPEGGSWIALVEVDAGNAADAVAQAWMRYAGRPPPEPLMAPPLANRNGWTDGRNHIYRAPAGEPRQLSARAMRNGTRWVVRIDDIATALAGKRAADLRLIRDEFLPAGYVRERFAGRKAHAFDADKLDELKAFVGRSRLLLGVPGISIGIVQGGKVVYAGGFGVRENGKPEPVDADTLYPIASNTKSLTTLMLAKLVDEGRFRWDTPVAELLPGFALADADVAAKMQVRHLSCACAGLPYRNLDWEFAPADAPASIVFDILRRMRPTSAFGSSYQYTNPPAAAAGYLGGHVAYPELEFGQAYDRAMATRVFEPLGMTRTTFDFDRAMRGNFARSHGVGMDGGIALVDARRDRQMHAVRPTGGAWSNVDDLLAYLRLELSGGRLPGGRRHLSESALRERWKPQIGTGRQAWYGLGLDTDASSGTPMLYHGGRLYGQRSNMVWWPEHDVGLVVLMNSSTGNVLMDALPRKLMEVVFDGQPEADSMVAAAAATEREQRETRRREWTFPAGREHAALLASRYRNELLGELRVERSQDKLHFRFDAWDMPVASRRGPDGAVEFVGAIPSPPPPLVAGSSPSGRTLSLRDAQNEYVFTEAD